MSSVNGDDTALADVTNKVNGIKINEEAIKRARDSGFPEPEKYDYDTYNKSSRDQAPAPAADDGEDDDTPTWATNAMRYEWSDEYGDVGPEHKALEKILFGGKNKSEKGDFFDK